MAGSPARLDPARLCSGLERAEDGVWYDADRAAVSPPVSYDARISSECFDLEDDSYWFAHRQRCILAALARRPSPDGVVDIGGGNGFVAQGFLRAGIPVLLLEPSAVAVRNARQRGLPDVVCATVQSAGLRPESAPAIGLFDVLEHVADDRGFLRELVEFLRPGGRLYLTVPALRWLWSIEDTYAGHFRRYHQRDLRASFEASGLVLEYSTYLFAPLVPPVFLLRGAASLLRLRRRVSLARNTREHTLPSGWPGRLIQAALDRELRTIERGSRQRIGTSLLAVARKPETPQARAPRRSPARSR